MLTEEEKKWETERRTTQATLLSPEQAQKKRDAMLEELLDMGRINCACCGERKNQHYTLLICSDCGRLFEEKDFVALGKTQEIAIEKGLVRNPLIPIRVRTH